MAERVQPVGVGGKHAHTHAHTRSRMLGRACTFDDLEELTDVSAETHRR